MHFRGDGVPFLKAAQLMLIEPEENQDEEEIDIDPKDFMLIFYLG